VHAADVVSCERVERERLARRLRCLVLERRRRAAGRSRHRADVLRRTLRAAAERRERARARPLERLAAEQRPRAERRRAAAAAAAAAAPAADAAPRRREGVELGRVRERRERDARAALREADSFRRVEPGLAQPALCRAPCAARAAARAAAARRARRRELRPVLRGEDLCEARVLRGVRRRDEDGLLLAKRCLREARRAAAAPPREGDFRRLDPGVRVRAVRVDVLVQRARSRARQRALARRLAARARERDAAPRDGHVRARPAGRQLVLRARRRFELPLALEDRRFEARDALRLGERVREALRGRARRRRVADAERRLGHLLLDGGDVGAEGGAGRERRAPDRLDRRRVAEARRAAEAEEGGARGGRRLGARPRRAERALARGEVARAFAAGSEHCEGRHCGRRGARTRGQSRVRGV
jgi:hypothetical protein